MAKIVTLKDHKTNELAYPQTVSDAVYMDNGSTLEQYKESVSRQFANYPNVTVTGTVTNLPDNEDIRETEQHTLQLADRNNLEGMGYVVLRKNKSFAEQVIYENTIYEIRYDFDLGGGSVTIPNGCVLKFNGGSLNNGSVIGDNTVITASKNTSIFAGISISGTWNVPDIYSSWFSDAENLNKLKDVFRLQNSSIHNSIHIDVGTYLVSVSGEGESALGITSNTTILNSGTIQLSACGFERYYIVRTGGSNVLWRGGSIVGDKDAHTGATGENGMGMGIMNAENVKVFGVNIEKCWGDCIYIGNSTGSASVAVTIDSCSLHDCRRNGISVTHADRFVISNCKIYNISGTDPQRCIDVEANDGCYCTNGIIKNNIMYGIYSVLVTRMGTGYADRIKIENNIIDCTGNASAAVAYQKYSLSITGKSTNVIVSGNTIGSRGCYASSIVDNNSQVVFNSNSIVGDSEFHYCKVLSNYISGFDISSFEGCIVEDNAFSPNPSKVNGSIPVTCASGTFFNGNRIQLADSEYTYYSPIQSRYSCRIIGNFIGYNTSNVSVGKAANLLGSSGTVYFVDNILPEELELAVDPNISAIRRDITT